MREIRVLAEPAWEADRVDITLFFLFDHIDEIPPNADTCMTTFVNLITETPRYTLAGLVRALDQITAAAYLNSDALDLDALSDG